MANPILIRPWSRLTSLRSSPPVQESHPKSLTAEPSLIKATNTSSHDNNASSATKSLPTAPDFHNLMLPQKLKIITPVTFPSAKLTMEKPNGNDNDNTSLKNESGESKKQGNNNEKQVTYKENENKEKGTDTKLSGSHEGRGLRVITISGENRGAYMQITQSQKKPIHKMANCDGKDKLRTLSSPPMRALYGNRNVQCVNNSMLFHTSLVHDDPALRLIIPKKPIHADTQLN